MLQYFFAGRCVPFKTDERTDAENAGNMDSAFGILSRCRIHLKYIQVPFHLVANKMYTGEFVAKNMANEHFWF